MVDNTSLNQECNTLRQAVLGNVGAKVPQHRIPLHDWLDDVDDCWKKNNKNLPAEVDELYKKLLTSSRFFMSFSESFLAKKDSEEEMREPISPNIILANYLETYIEVMTQGSKIDDSDANVKGFWQLPFELWQQQIRMLGELPDSFLQFLKTSSEDSLQDTEFVIACERYFEVLQEYQSAYIAMSLNAAKEMIQLLEAADGSSVESVSEQVCKLWMDTWIDVFEKHYAVFVRDAGYSKLYAEVINSWMLVIQQAEKVITPWIKTMNIPTRDDL